MIFTGNFIISVNNFKDYLQIESKTKSQDTATSLGVRLKPLINENVNDPEIGLIISAIGNSGFYKEIRLEIAQFEFSKDDLILDEGLFEDDYNIKDVHVDKINGIIVDAQDDNDMANELAALEGEDGDGSFEDQTVYTFVPAKHFPNKKALTVYFTAYNDTKSVETSATIQIDRVPVQIIRKEKFDDIPQWFIDWMPLTMVETKSEIVKWKTQAIIYISANAGDAYAKLFEQAKGAMEYAALSFTIAFTILIVFLRFILRPLTNIEELAKNISQGNFDTIKQLPWTTELRNVSISMNDMSSKIKNMISKLNSNLEKMTDQLSQDDLTGLQLEQTFQTDMKQMFIKKIDGYVFSVKIYDFGHFAKNNPHKVVDQFLKEFANILKECDKDTTAYRFFGSTFAMISKKTDHQEIISLVNNLKKEFEKLSLKYELSSVAHIGVTPFNPISTTDDILAQANEAYEMAKQIGHNEASIRDKNDLARDMLEWKDLIDDIIKNNKFKVGYINQAISMDDKAQVLLEEAFTSATDKENKPIAIGTFVSIAEKYDMVIDFDKAVIKQVINNIKENNVRNEILINLAFDSLMNENFKSWTQDILQQNQQIASQLVFSVTAYGCVRDTQSFKNFIELVHKNGGKVILKRFETKFIPLDTLKDFHLDYIRLARDYTNGIANDSGKQSFVESICELSKLLNIKVFAESVKDEDCFIKLKELGLHGASK
jgi:diguanylate cyclase (GGDEF)-like protein